MPLSDEKEVQLCEDVASIKNQLIGVSKTLSRMEKNNCEDRKAIQDNSNSILVMKTESKAYSKLIGGAWAVFAFVMNIIVLIIWGSK